MPSTKIVISALMAFSVSSLTACVTNLGDGAIGEQSPPDSGQVAANCHMKLMTRYSKAPMEAERVSAFGKYSGYRDEVFNGYSRTSQYVVARDGVRLAVDVNQPTVDGVVSRQEKPTILIMTPYGRAAQPSEGSGSSCAIAPPSLQPDGVGQALVAYGYNLVVVDKRGYGASFGARERGVFSEQDGEDGADIVNWIAEQPWSDGNVGMIGSSASGLIQHLVASEGPAPLKAIMPSMTSSLDMIDNLFISSNGIRIRHLQDWADWLASVDLDDVSAAFPVDEDPDRRLLSDALVGRESIAQAARQTIQALKVADYASQSPAPLQAMLRSADRISENNIPTYVVGGWYDGYAPGIFFENLDTPKKMVVGFWPHTPGSWPEGSEDPRYRDEIQVFHAEALRWFDHWLLGIENSVMTDASVQVASADFVARGSTWLDLQNWRSVAQDEATRFYMSQRASQTLPGPGDGSLSTIPDVELSRLERAADYSATTGDASRSYSISASAVVEYRALSENAEKGISFTTDPFEKPMRILGYPTVNLTFSSDAEDEDLFVFLTQVDPSGQSYLLSEGMLRASRRTIGNRPYDTLGLPMPSLRRADIKPLSGSLDEPADLSFTLSPIAVDIPRGHRVRVDIQASEGYALDPIVHNPPSKRSVWLGGADGSFLDLPISEIEPN